MCASFCTFAPQNFMMKNISKILNFRNVISYLQVASLWLLILSLAFYISSFQRWIMIVAGGMFIVDYVANRRWSTWCWHRNKWLYVAMIALYICIPLWQIGSDTYNPRVFSYALEDRMPLLLVGIVGILGFGDRVKLRHVCYVFIIGCIFSSLYIIFRGAGFSFFTHLPAEQSEIFWQTRVELVNSHMMYNLYLNTGLVFAFYLLQQSDLKRWIRISVVAACFWIFYILCLTEGRIGLFTGLLIGAIFLLFYTFRRGLKWFLPVASVYLIFAVLMIAQHKRFETNAMRGEPRWLIWHAVVDVIQENPIMGHGVCDAKASLTEKALVGEGDLQNFYRPQITAENIHRLPHPHNAFLQAWCDFGIIGLAIILFIFIFPLTMRPKKHRIYVFMIVGCFVIQCMTDVFFSPQPLLYGIAIMLFTSEKYCRTQNDKVDKVVV